MSGQTQGLYQTPTTATGTSIVARKNLSALQASSIVPAHKPPVSVMEMVMVKCGTYNIGCLPQDSRLVTKMVLWGL